MALGLGAGTRSIQSGTQIVIFILCESVLLHSCSTPIREVAKVHIPLKSFKNGLPHRIRAVPPNSAYETRITQDFPAHSVLGSHKPNGPPSAMQLRGGFDALGEYIPSPLQGVHVCFLRRPCHALLPHTLLRHAACTDLTAAPPGGAMPRTEPTQRPSHARWQGEASSGHKLKQTEDSTRSKGGGWHKGQDSRPGTTSIDVETTDVGGAEEPSGTDFLDEIKRRIMGAGISRTPPAAASTLGSRPEQVCAGPSIYPRELERSRFHQRGRERR